MAKNKKKIIIWAIIGCVAVIIALIIMKKKGVIGSSNIPMITVEKATSRTLIEIVTAIGKIQPETEVKLSPDVSGEIIELAIKEGATVKKGDFLLKIKPYLYESALERTIAAGSSSSANLKNAQARLEQIKAQFSQTELNYNRDKKLYEQKVISQSEFEASESAYQMGIADVKAAEANVNSASYSIVSAQASIREANENLQKTTVFAPMDGTVSALNVEIGERVVGTEMMAGTEMMRIANLDIMEVIVDVSENSIAKIKLNDTADVEVYAYLNRKFSGIVTEIANSANVASTSSIEQVTNFKVKIKLLPESYKDLVENGNIYPLRPGMSATVDIHTKVKYNVLSVPMQSVTTRADISDTTSNTDKSKMVEVVYVYKDGKVLQKKVKTGIQDSNYIEIIEGLEKDEEVVSAPYNMISKILYDKMQVRKVSTSELFKVKQ
jgi:HlyD family secretion protein